MTRDLDPKTIDAKAATRIVRLERGAGAPVRRVETDICVVGTGIAGVSAAIEAARLGRRVTVVDGLPTLGGQAVHGIIGTFCGLFANSPDVDKQYQFTHGIADDILRDLGAAGALHYRRSMWTTVMYDEVALSRWIERTMMAEGIDAILGAVMRRVNTDGRRVRSLDLATRYGDIEVVANSFIDATGDASLAWNAGLPCREPLNGKVYGSQMVVIEDVETDGMPPREDIAHRLEEVGDAYGLVRKEGFAFGFPARGTALVNMTHIETPMDSIGMARQSILGKDQADLGIDFLKKEFPENFGSARVKSYGQLGIRQTRWIAGVTQLTLDDVLEGTHFDDAIARTAWGVELHDEESSHIFHTFGEGHIHYVPLGSLLPPDCDNLVAVGRCVDADVAALSSVRVMGPCIAMGAAAANVLDLVGEGSVHDVDVPALQDRLSDNLFRTDSAAA